MELDTTTLLLTVVALPFVVAIAGYFASKLIEYGVGRSWNNAREAAAKQRKYDRLLGYYFADRPDLYSVHMGHLALRSALYVIAIGASFAFSVIFVVMSTSVLIGADADLTDLWPALNGSERALSLSASFVYVAALFTALYLLRRFARVLEHARRVRRAAVEKAGWPLLGDFAPGEETFSDVPHGQIPKDDDPSSGPEAEAKPVG